MVSLPRRSEPAGVTDSTDSPASRCNAEYFRRCFIGYVDQEAAGGALEEVRGFQNILFALFAEAFEIAKLSFTRQFFDAFDRGDFEFLPKQRDFLGAE